MGLYIYIYILNLYIYIYISRKFLQEFDITSHLPGFMGMAAGYRFEVIFFTALAVLQGLSSGNTKNS